MGDYSTQLSSSVPVDQRQLWQNLADFPFDLDSVSKPFSTRLAAENGWSKSFTDGVINEYRRFLFLTAVAGHTVCPSEEVDAVWHQHMIYSRSYWDRLCRETLNFPLHHDPSAGGSAEGRKHWQMYQKTLESYRRIFDEEPPRQFWPLPFERFDPTSQPRMVNMRDCWVLRKPTWWPRQFQRHAGVAAFLLPIPALGLGPLNWTGPEFLLLFFILSLILFIGSIVYVRIHRDLPVLDDRNPSTEEIACLKFGRPAAVNATVAAMLHLRQLVSIPATGFFGQVNGAKVTFAPGSIEPSEELVLASAIRDAVDSSPKTLSELQLAMSSQTQEMETRLCQSGYLLDESQLFSARLVPWLSMIALLVLGFTKIVIGLQRERSVGFLLLGCVAVVISFLIVILSFRRSLAGDKLLRSLHSHYRDLKPALQQPDCSGKTVALCTALYGAGVLEAPLFDHLKSAWMKNASTSSQGNSGAGCGGGCGGTGSGCSGGGGGGCGGGGCGGCGGG